MIEVLLNPNETDLIMESIYADMIAACGDDYCATQTITLKNFVQNGLLLSKLDEAQIYTDETQSRGLPTYLEAQLDLHNKYVARIDRALMECCESNNESHLYDIAAGLVVMGENIDRFHGLINISKEKLDAAVNELERHMERKGVSALKYRQTIERYRQLLKELEQERDS